MRDIHQRVEARGSGGENSSERHHVHSTEGVQSRMDEGQDTRLGHTSSRCDNITISTGRSNSSQSDDEQGARMGRQTGRFRDMDSSDESSVEYTWGEALSTDELLFMRDIYADVRKQNPMLSKNGLPVSPSWLRWRKLQRNSTRYGVCRFATFSRQVASLDIHSLAFEYGSPLVIAGIANHELSHFVAGFESGHDEYFNSLERGWKHYDEWKQEMLLFVGWVRQFNSSNPFDARTEHLYRCKGCDKTITKRGHPYYSLVRCRTCGIHTGLDSTLIYVGEHRKTKKV